MTFLIKSVSQGNDTSGTHVCVVDSGCKFAPVFFVVITIGAYSSIG